MTISPVGTRLSCRECWIIVTTLRRPPILTPSAATGSPSGVRGRRRGSRWRMERSGRTWRKSSRTPSTSREPSARRRSTTWPRFREVPALGLCYPSQRHQPLHQHQHLLPRVIIIAKHVLAFIVKYFPPRSHLHQEDEEDC